MSSLYSKNEIVSIFGNSTIIFKLLMFLSEEEFTTLNKHITAKEINKFKEYTKTLLEKYQYQIKKTYINPAIVRAKLTERLILLDFPFLRNVAIEEK